MVDFHTPGGVDRDGWQYAVNLHVQITSLNIRLIILTSVINYDFINW